MNPSPDFLSATASTPSAIRDGTTGFGFNTVVFAFIPAIFLAARLFTGKAKGKLPPGPPGLPIVGNLLQLSDRSWLTFTKWKKQYGPLIYINVAGQNTVVIGSHKVAADLLDRRASIYSDRPRNIVAAELLTGGLIFAFAQHNDIWKRMRRGSHEALNNRVAKTYHGFQETETTLLIDHFLKTPKDFDSHLRRTSTSLFMSIIYGLPPLKDSDDPRILLVNRFVERALAAAAPGAFLVEYFTWMEHLPRWMSPWRRYAEDCFSRDSIMFEKLFSDTKHKIEAGDATDSVAAKLIEDQRTRNLTDKDSAWISATVYSAGAETSSGQLAWFILAMVLHPEAQERAQDEIDSVVGRDRLPTFQDYEQLPYVRALVKEVMRWRGVSPLGIPHRLCQDDWYNGHFLPKDTTCIVNSWQLNHDPDVYGPDADDFRPGRHLDESGKLMPPTPETKDESHVSYGFGRRICVGRYVANDTMFIGIARLLWAFNITPAKDARGNIILPDAMDSVDEGLVVRPAKFPCTITPRSIDVESVVAHTMELRGITS